MSNQIKNIIQESINVKDAILKDELMLQTLSSCVTDIVNAFKNGNKVLFCGNGGSAADAQHLAAEFSGRFYTDRDALPAEALHVNTSYLTAVANDYSYDVVYSRIIKGIGKKGDVLVGLSTSGNSGNIVKAFETAKEKGMEVSETVDERYHLEKSTEAACKYLLSAKEKFGSWTLAAASYNGGMTGVGKKIEEQKVSNYYDLALTEETSRYVFRILALKEIMRNPANYGFSIFSSDLYSQIPSKKIEIDSSINDLANFAKTQGINYKILKIHNPWLRDKKLLNPTKKKYEIEIPLSGY
jgi:phosphoheptose isomerase